MFFFSYIFVTVNQKTFYKFKTVTKMKKMIFTAMAVLAFSAVSMANTIEVKEEVVAEDCYEKAMDAVDIAEEDDPIFNFYLYQVVLRNCLKNQ
jgi:hypothetical protein